MHSMSRRAEAVAANLPPICLPRHFVPSSNLFRVPVWELPPDLTMILEEAACGSGHLAMVAPACGDFHPSVAEDPHHSTEEPQRGSWPFVDEDDSGSLSCDDSQISVSSADQLDATARIWSLGLLENSPMLVRRMQRGHPGSSYGLAISALLCPRRIYHEGSDALLDAHLFALLKMQHPRWAVLALHSGYFSGAVFCGPEVLVHKTFHRYTSRAKQGGSQAASDARGNKAKSAGANLRRYGEQRLREEIHELLTRDWAKDLASTDLIFISASNQMRSALTGTMDKPALPFDKIRRLPFMRTRPTFELVRSVYTSLTGIVFASSCVAEALTERCKTSSCHLMEKTRHSRKRLLSGYGHDEGLTALHVAALKGDEDHIIELLEAGADSTAVDSKGRAPIELCTARRARRAFEFWENLQVDSNDKIAADDLVHDKATREVKRKGRRRRASHQTQSIEHTAECTTKDNSAHYEHWVPEDRPQGRTDPTPLAEVFFSRISPHMVSKCRPGKHSAPQRKAFTTFVAPGIFWQGHGTHGSSTGRLKQH